MMDDIRLKIEGRTDGWTDNTNDSSLDYDFMTRHPELSISFLVFTSISVTLGNIGNIMVIGAVVSYRPLLRNKGSMFVINLAIADLCITGIVSPMNMVGVTHGPQYFVDRVVLCNILGSICTVSCIVSMLSIAAVAVNRALQICCYFSYEDIFTMKKTIGYCAGLWLFSICADLPNWLGVGGHTFALKEMGCTWDRTANHTYSVIMASLNMLSPMLIVLTSYTVIYCYVRKSNEKYKTYLGGMDKRRKRDERQFAFTLLVSFAVFVLCWSLYMTAVIFDRDDTWPKQVYVFGTMIGHANSFINPIIYAALNGNFRHGYGVFLKRLTCREVPKEAYLKERRHSAFISSRKTSCTDLRSSVGSIQQTLKSEKDIKIPVEDDKPPE